jgi:LPS-assembly lipoprotein
MKMRNSILVLGLCLALGACGFKPLYGTGDDGGPQAGLAHVTIPEPGDRFTQLIRNELLSSMAAPGSDGAGLYRLELRQTRATPAVIRSKAGLNQREMVEATVTFRLVDARSGKLLKEGRTFANIPFDRVGSEETDTPDAQVNSEFANVQAEANAGERAAIQVADDIRTRLAVYFAANPTP